MYTINQVCKITGIQKAALRFYDSEGIICPKRQKNGYRVYDETDILLLKYLSLLKYAQFPLSKIKILINGKVSASNNEELSTECAEKCLSIINNGISKLKKAIENYEKIIDIILKAFPIIGDSEKMCADNRLKIDNFIKNLYNDIKGE